MTEPSAERWVCQILNSVGCGVIVLDRSGAVILANARAKSLAESAGVESVGQLLNSELACAGFGVERQPLAETDGFDLVLLNADDPASRAEAALARVARLEEALRDLSVVSHQINNPLTALLGRAQMLRAKSHADPLVEKSVLVVDESAVRVAGLAKELSKLLKEARRESVESLLLATGRLESAGASSGR